MTLACLLLLSIGSPCAEPDEARAILEKAIKAHGGEKNLLKRRCMRISGEGVFPPQQDGDMEFKFRFEDTFHSPKQLKRVIELLSKEFPLKYVMVLDGDKAWLDTSGFVEELTDKRLDEMKQMNHAHRADQLVHLLDKPYQLEKLDEIRLPSGPALGVKVTAKGWRDVKLYFDKKTHLLVKREHVSLGLLDGSDMEVVQEDFFGDYKEFDGLQHWTTMITHHGGKKTTEAKVTAIKFFEKLDAKEFQKP